MSDTTEHHMTESTIVTPEEIAELLGSAGKHWPHRCPDTSKRPLYDHILDENVTLKIANTAQKEQLARQAELVEALRDLVRAHDRCLEALHWQPQDAVSFIRAADKNLDAARDRLAELERKP